MKNTKNLQLSELISLGSNWNMSVDIICFDKISIPVSASCDLVLITKQLKTLKYTVYITSYNRILYFLQPLGPGALWARGGNLAPGPDSQ